VPLDLVSKRTQRILLVAWCCFIIYGSFIPFHFSANSDFVRPRLAHLELFPYQEGTRNFSLLDLVSNVLLFIPFGFLLSGSGVWRTDRSWTLRIGVSAVLALLFSTSIELGQLFSPSRTASGIDVEANVMGALLGAISARLFHGLGEWVDGCVRLAQDEPRLVGITLLALWLCSDAFYPFELTLDVSTLWQNFKHARWIPFHESQRFLLDRVVDEAVMFGMLAAVVGSALRRRVSGGMAALTAACIGIAFICMLEAGKLFFVGRSPDVENVVLASLGGVVGATAVPVVMAWGPVERHTKQALCMLALSLLAYSELTPFAFGFSASGITAQIRRIDWIPFFEYYGADPQSALFGLWKKLLLSGFWGYSVTRLGGATPLAAGASGLVLGALLEAAQILTATRIPSVTDMLDFGLGAWIGGLVSRHSRRAATARSA